MKTRKKRSLGRGLSALFGDMNDTPKDPLVPAMDTTKPIARSLKQKSLASEGSHQSTMRDVSDDLSSSSINPKLSDTKKETGNQSEILPKKTETVQGGAHDASVIVREKIIQIDADKINTSNYHASREFQKLDESQKSMITNGLMAPVLVLEDGDGNGNSFEVITGEHRLCAYLSMGYGKIPCIVKKIQKYDDIHLMGLLQIIEREKMSLLEEAHVYNLLKTRFNLKSRGLAAKLGKSPNHVSTLIRVQSLTPEIIKEIKNGVIRMGHIKVLVSHPDPSWLARQIITNKMTVRETEQLAQKHLKKMLKGEKEKGQKISEEELFHAAARIRVESQNKKTKEASSGLKQRRPLFEDDFKEITARLQKVMGNKVDVQARYYEPESHYKHQGQVVIDFTDLDDLDTILKSLSYSGK